MTTLLQLKSFVTVVDQGGFTAASRRLGLSQPAVSRAVATLEKELGLPLLVRGRDGLSLTEAGSLALTHAREAVRHLTLMRTEVAALAGEVTGTLSLASLPSVTAHSRRSATAGLRRAISGRDDPAARRERGGGAGLAGSGRRRGRCGQPARPRTGRPRCSATRTWSRSCLPPTGWPHGHEVSYAELAKEPFVRSTGGCAEVFTPVARRVGVDFDVAFEAREMSAVLEIVRAGLGVSIMPSAGLPDLPDGVVVRPLVPKTVRRLGVAVSASASAAARAFLEQIAALDLH